MKGKNGTIPSRLLAVILTGAALLSTSTAGLGQPAPPAPPEQAPRPDGSLSDQLDRTDGVIPAPSVGDQEIRIEPPATGSDMPVIAPPGTPGNQPNVRPE